MKLSETCLKDVLAYLEENLTITVDTTRVPKRYKLNAVDCQSMFEDLKGKYSDECELYYAIHKLLKMGFIECIDGNDSISAVKDITPLGHQYLWNINKK